MPSITERIRSILNAQETEKQSHSSEQRAQIQAQENWIKQAKNSCDKIILLLREDIVISFNEINKNFLNGKAGMIQESDVYVLSSQTRNVHNDDWDTSYLNIAFSAHALRWLQSSRDTFFVVAAYASSENNVTLEVGKILIPSWSSEKPSVKYCLTSHGSGSHFREVESSINLDTLTPEKLNSIKQKLDEKIVEVFAINSFQ